ncbi:MAG TPA: phenylacetate--CoA ligase family protein [Proteobacteria bacterium]|nr:phenylacetate--CoA ligase family protein [Pseudomonadota bacterium]
MGIFSFVGTMIKARPVDRLTPEKIMRRADKRLKKLVKLAKERAPFYAKLYSHIDVEDFRITDLPPTTKEMLMENFQDTLTVDDVDFNEVKAFVEDPSRIGELYKNRYVLVHTSGTTGIKGYFVYSKNSWAMVQALYLLRSKWETRFFPDIITRLFNPIRYAMVIPLGGHYATLLAERVSPSRLKNVYYKIKLLSILDPIDKVIAELNEFQPEMLHGYPTYMEKLAYEKIKGNLDISPEFVSVASETLTDQARALLEKAFGVKIANYYGTTECVEIAYQCPYGKMHLHQDWVFLEPVDEDDNPVPPGTESHHVLVTNLYNTVQPIIRYRLDDVVVWEKDQRCECGSPLPVIRVIGRAYDNFWVKDKFGQYTSFAPIGLQVILIEVDGLRAFQMVQEERNRIHMLYVAEDGAEPKRVESQIREKLDRYFVEQNLDGCIELDLEQVHEIPRDPVSGKVKLFYSKVGVPDEVLKA